MAVSYSPDSRAFCFRSNLLRNQYMLSKCRWKMFCCDESMRGGRDPVDVETVVDSLIDTIQILPERKDSRSEPILEPHFKLVSIVHKLVHRGFLEARSLLRICCALTDSMHCYSPLKPARPSSQHHGHGMSLLRKMLMHGSRLF